MVRPETAPPLSSRHPTRLLRYTPARHGTAATAWALATKATHTQDKMRLYEARQERDWDMFEEAVRREVDSLWAINTWYTTDFPAGKSVTATTMLCESKRGATGEVDRYNGRLVVRGDTQMYPTDYTDVWAPVARNATQRTLLGVAASDVLSLLQLDIETAFLNGDLEEEIYIHQPKGYDRGDK